MDVNSRALWLRHFVKYLLCIILVDTSFRCRHSFYLSMDHKIIRGVLVGILGIQFRRRFTGTRRVFLLAIRGILTMGARAIFVTWVCAINRFLVVLQSFIRGGLVIPRMASNSCVSLRDDSMAASTSMVTRGAVRPRIFLEPMREEVKGK